MGFEYKQGGAKFGHHCKGEVIEDENGKRVANLKVSYSQNDISSGFFSRNSLLKFISELKNLEKELR